MKLTLIAFAAAAVSTIAAPAMAATYANPAASLSVSRAGTPSHGKSKLHGEGAGIVALLAAGMVGGAIYAITDNKSQAASR